MDAPLVLTTVLNPEEVDDQVHDLDIAWSYPLEFYTAARGNGSVTQNVETLKKRIGKETQFSGFGFSTSTANINNGPFLTAYRSLGSMLDKVRAQLALAERINAVDADDVARLVIETHFIKDIRGNMRTFCRQQFRCTNCNEKYRRIPLVGRCTKCGGQLLLTVHQGTVEKYLEPTMQITKKYKVPEYMTQELQILQRRLSAMFGRGQQQSLAQWF